MRRRRRDGRTMSPKSKRRAKAARSAIPCSRVTSRGTPPSHRSRRNTWLLAQALLWHLLRHLVIFAEFRMSMPAGWSRSTAGANAGRQPGDGHGVYAGPEQGVDCGKPLDDRPPHFQELPQGWGLSPAKAGRFINCQASLKAGWPSSAR